MFNIVDRYIARNVIVTVIYCTIGLVLLACLIKFVDQIRSIGKGEFDSFAVRIASSVRCVSVNRSNM